MSQNFSNSDKKISGFDEHLPILLPYTSARKSFFLSGFRYPKVYIKADIRNPLRCLLITHCLLLHAMEAGDLPDSVKKGSGIVFFDFIKKKMLCGQAEGNFPSGIRHSIFQVKLRLCLQNRTVRFFLLQ